MKLPTLLAAPLVAQLCHAIDLNLDDPNSIKDAAKTAAQGMMKWYTGNSAPGGVPGLLPGPYYWWEAGAMFGAMIDYWYYTGDDTWNDITKEALLFQVGPGDSYMPPNQSKSLGNDDQVSTPISRHVFYRAQSCAVIMCDKFGATYHKHMLNA